ncbi:hypothetical protein BCR44DRAFT_34138 [Catenaria anguillulae PL171]|uniref:P-loop containing nucleoside triphosphate hydrolase protein n=1 Tax=Catenaria anguillulae PL171 TaxID=765915 RepID=A0A1Y2HUR0_9FUNG|nr:hypothetical protein BCR44DRAFT_34138 [Catenaria anguillulae PL171]
MSDSHSLGGLSEGPGQFCAYELGQASLSSARDIDLTLCAQNTILTPTITAAFLVFAIARFVRLRGKPDIPDNRPPWLVAAKWILPPAITLTALALLIVHLVNTSGQFTDMALFALLTTLTLAIASAMHIVEHKRNRAPSGTLSMYYLFNILLLGWRVRAVATLVLVPTAELVLFACLVGGHVVLLGLECLSVRPYDPLAPTVDPMASPEPLAHIFARIFFTWPWPIVKRGYSKYLTLDDMWTLQSQHTAQDNYTRFIRNFEQYRSRGHRHALLFALGKTYGLGMLLVLTGLLVVQVFNFCVPLLVERLIAYVGAWALGGVSKVQGVVIAFGFLGLSVMSSLIYNATFYKCFLYDMIVRAGLMNAVYHKAMRIPSHDRDSTGSLVNHLQVDAFAVARVFFDLPNMAIVPLQVISYLALLYLRIGIAAVISFVLVFMAALLISWFAKKTLGYQKSRLDAMDERIRLTSEAIKGVRTIKLYGWNPFFQSRIERIRDRELAALQKSNAMMSFQAAFSILIPNLLAFATFTLSTVIGDVVFNPQTVFVVLSVLQMLANPLNALIWGFSPLMSAVAGYGRLRKFFEHIEMDSEGVSMIPDGQDGGVAIRIKDGYFFWENAAAVTAAKEADAKAAAAVDEERTKLNGYADKEPDDRKYKKAAKRPHVTHVAAPADLQECTLKGIDLEIAKGSLTAVVATVGQGKSSLVSAMLGEIYKARGTVERAGSVAYVPQTPFVVNATVRDNITFGHHYDPKLYARVIHACSLTRDFAVLAKGDLTTIGEHGINLSGGQRARISCARACYAALAAESVIDIVIFDDPLSAVDAHVDAHMFEHMLGPNSILSGKTRVLVTHAVHHLPEVDRIVLLESGRIVDQGRYTQLAERAKRDPSSVFARLVTVFNNKRRGGGANEQDLGDLVVEDETGHVEVAQRSASVSDDDDQDAILAVPEELMHSQDTLVARRAGGARSAAEDLERASLLGGDVDNDAQSIRSAGSLRRRASRQSSISKLKKQSLAQDEADVEESAGIDSDNEDEEHMERGSVSRDVYLAYIKFCGVWAFVINITLSSICVGLTLGVQYVLGSWSRAVEVDPSPATTWKWLGTFAGMVALNTLLTGCAFYFFFAFIAIRCSRVTSATLLRRVLRLPMSFFDVTPSGRVINRFSKDQDGIDSMLPPQIHHYFYSVLQLGAILVAIATATPWFLALVLPLAIIFYRVQDLFLRTSRELQRLGSVTRSPIFQAFSESLEGLSSIRAYGQQARFHESIEAKIDTANKPLYTQLGINRWLGVILQLISTMMLFGSALFAALSPEKGTTLIGVSLTFAQQLSWMLIMIVRVYCDIETNIVAVERIREYSETAPEAPDTTDYPLDAAWPTKGHIEFVDYSTRYRPGLDLVLRNLSLSIQGGEKIGIVGRTGSGKSSSLAALFRLMESATGSILVDGVNVADLGLLDLRTRLTVLPQEPTIFECTVRENLDPTGTHSDQDLWKALETAHLKDVISALSGGLDTKIKQGSLSVGQAQLLCLSRAILRKTKILALDEASASIDHATDELVQSTIRQVFDGCTILCIAHRVSTVHVFLICLPSIQPFIFDSHHIASRR